MKYLRSAVSWALRALIIAYRYGLAPVLGAHCRYAPSCSAYAHEAIGAHGPWRGSWLALRRILRCHPWGGAGYDPVPTAGSGNYEHRSARSPGAAKLGEG